MTANRMIRRKENTFRGYEELKVKAIKLPKARENASDQGAFGFSFASKWLRKWRKFSNPITRQSQCNLGLFSTLN